VFDWDPVPPPVKGHSPVPPNFRPMSVVAKRLDDLSAEVGLDSGEFVFDGDPPPPRKKAQPPHIFGLCLLWPNGWMDQDATLYGGKPCPGDVVLDGIGAPPLKGHSPQFSVYVYCGQAATWMKTSLFTEVDLGPCHVVLDGDPAPSRKGHCSPPLCVATVAHLSYC